MYAVINPPLIHYRHYLVTINLSIMLHLISRKCKLIDLYHIFYHLYDRRMSRVVCFRGLEVFLCSSFVIALECEFRVYFVMYTYNIRVWIFLVIVYLLSFECVVRFMYNGLCRHCKPGWPMETKVLVPVAANNPGKCLWNHQCQTKNFQS